MRKNTGKVLSMILAMAMVVSSFSATFVSASTQEVVGTNARVDTDDGKIGDTDYDLVSDKYTDLTLIADLDNAYLVRTMDREELDDVEYVSFTKVSGDSLVKVVRDKEDDDKRNLVLKKNASGTETIRINYKGTYTDDDTDREVTARGSIEVDITATVEGTVVLAEAKDWDGDTPDEPGMMAVNDSGMTLALYMAYHDDGDPTAKWDNVVAYQDVDDDDALESYTEAYFDISSDKNFVKSTEDIEADENQVINSEGDVTGAVYHAASDPTGYTVEGDDGYLYLGLKHEDEEGGNYFAKTFSTKLEIYAPKVTFNAEDQTFEAESDKKGDRIRVDIGVDKKWRVTEEHDDGYAEISKLGARTLVALNGASNDFDDMKYTEIEDQAKVISGYEIVVDSGRVVMNGGSIESINIDREGSILIENGTVSGNVDADNNITIGEGAKVGGTVKNAATVELQDGAVVGAVDAGNVTMDGATVDGNVDADEFTANDNDEYNNVVRGDISANKFDIDAIDGSFEATGALIATMEGAEYAFEGDNISIGSIDGDYYDPDVTFDDSDITIAVTNMNSFNTSFTLQNEADVSISGSARLGSIEVEEDSVLRFLADATVDEMSGDGMVVAQAGQFHIKSGIADVALKLNNLAIGATAFTADTDAVDENDFNGVGYSLTKEAASSTVDRFVVDAVSFAGLSFDKEFVTIAQGYSDTITLAAYPTGTNAPADARVMWELDGNDDAFNVVVDPNTNVATINVTAYNADDNTANNATIRAYLVDEDGYELEGYVAATCKVTAVAQPEIRGTLKADTTSYTLPVGGIYDIQFSVTGVDATPVVTDSRTGSVFQLTNLGNNKYRVTGVNEGTAYVVATVGDTRVSVAITVDNDATQGGEKGNNVSEIR